MLVQLLNISPEESLKQFQVHYMNDEMNKKNKLKKTDMDGKYLKNLYYFYCKYLINKMLK